MKAQDAAVRQLALRRCVPSSPRTRAAAIRRGLTWVRIMCQAVVLPHQIASPLGKVRRPRHDYDQTVRYLPSLSSLRA